jgi:predicted small metal-binding protein
MIIFTSVVSRTILGIEGFHAKCSCGWTSSGTSDENVAKKKAADHINKAHSNLTDRILPAMTRVNGGEL